MSRFLNAVFGLLVALALNLTPAAFAVENTWDPSVQVSATVQSSPAKITLSWPQDTNGVPSSYTVYRRALNSSDWGGGTTLAGSSTSYVDTGVAVGSAYEYRLVKAASGYTGYGYITAGVEAALVDARGKVVLVVDNSIAGALASELTRLEADLRGDGWTVVRRDVNRTDSPASVKAVIKAVYDSDPANVKSVFLFGHVPVPYSGQLNPDGHPDHVGAWPADVYYGDMDGGWSDSSVNYTQTVNTDPVDAARLTNLPGDGKFDQTNIPSSVELQVGRVDLAKMPGRLVWGGPATFPSETELLRKYLNKDHNFRHRITNTQRRAILGDYFGYRGGEAFAASGFRSFAPLVGASNIRNLNIEFNDQRGVWIPQSASNDYLLAYGCGAGAYDAIMGIGSSGAYNAGTTADIFNNNVRGVFNMLFGSWLGDWDHEDNMLRAPLTTDTGLTSVWSGRPHWFMHHLGLGETIGYVARLNQNNAGQYQTIINSAENRIHIALMGDPTLRLHPVVPAANLNGSNSGSTTNLSWSGSSDSNVVGYHVYRASSATGAYTRLTSSPVTGTSYTDAGSFSGASYMVRAVKLENAASGTYYNASQGVFWTVGGSTTTPPPTTTVDATAPTISLSAPANGATVSANVTVTANATDNVGVVGVQFKIDGGNLGGEISAAPFGTTLNTTTLTNGTHTLGAVARDAAGNMASATVVSINVSNATVTDPVSTTSTPGGPGTTTTTTSTTLPTVLQTAGTLVWIDDALPTGAGDLGSSGGDTWNWVTTPAFSGAKGHLSAAASGQHEHWFGWSNNNLPVATGEVLFTYVYIDPANVPSEIMLSWSTSSSWEHRAYWGANKIDRGTNGSAGRYYAGALPAAGQWVRLEVPASVVGLEGQTVTAMNFSLVDGAATWDASGKALPGATSSTTTSSGTTSGSTTTSGTTTTSTSSGTTSTSTSSGTTSGSTTTAPSTTTTPTTTTTAPTTTTTAPTTSGGTETTWFDDALPTGAGGMGGNGDTWNWVTSGPTPISGSAAHQSALMTGEHSHWFGWSGNNFAIPAGDKLFVYVYLDPANVPSEVMISWSTDGSWDHRAYWGANKLDRGVNGTAGRYYAGALPAAGQWVRLEVPASAVGMEGQVATAMAFDLYDGRATFDKTGRLTGSTSTTTSSSTTSTSGSTTTTAPTVTYTDVIWYDDALPAGAGGAGGNGDTWNWVTSNPAPTSGTAAHQSALMAGEHSHWFGWSNNNFPVATGDKLFVYVYLDPANLPSEVMVSWSTDGSWDHRAYWGANKLDRGTNGTAGRYYAGALPAAGQWVRLEVAASAVGMEGQLATAMAFDLYDGRATFDKTGKATASTATTASTSTTPPTTTTTTPTTTADSSTTTTTTTSPTTSTTTASTTTTSPTTSTTSGSTSTTTTTSGSTTTTTSTPTTVTTTADSVWFDDALPAGAVGGAMGGDAWLWVASNPAPFAGSVAHQSNVKNTQHEHYFNLASQTLTVGTGDKLFVYVYLDPANLPQEILLSWCTDSWSHAARWGVDRIKSNRLGSTTPYYMGAMPAAGQWVRLEIPASVVGLEGQTVNGMGFALYDGRASWDKAGKVVTSTTTTNTTTTTPVASTTTSGGSTTTTTSGSGSTTTSGTSLTPSSVDTLWIDDALPTGAGDLGGLGGDSWNWVTSSPTPQSSGKAHQSALAAGQHEHWFGYSNQNLPIVAGDKLITYIYIDPANVPSEIMLSWSTSSSWEHRAYWGADKIGRGTNGTASRFYMGALPAAGQWVRLEVPASSVGLEGQNVTAMNFSLYDGKATWDSSGKNGAPPATNDPSIASGTASAGTTLTTAQGENRAISLPAVGDYQVRVLTPTMLEVQRILRKDADPAAIEAWNFVDSNGNFTAPATSQFAVTAGSNTINVSSVGFRRRVAYAKESVRDLRVDACLYLQLASPITEGQTVEVKNPSGALWPSSMQFITKADALRYSPAIHVNQEAYMPGFVKKAMVGYYLGNKGEMTFDSSVGFKLVTASTGVTVYSGALTLRKDVGYATTPLPYQNVYEADFSSFNSTGEYQLVVPGLGASLPFLINDGMAMAFARTYALGLYHQRCGTDNAMPFTRFVHAACHTGAAEVPSPQSDYAFTWTCIASKNADAKSDPRHTAPQLKDEASQLYPFVNKGKIDVSGGHHDAGDYSKYTINVSHLVHLLTFTNDSIGGASSLDNLGLPQSGDGTSDVIQEAKQEADFLAKMQDADGGFYFLVYPKNREYEGDVSPEFGDQQVVWPKTTAVTAAAVGALAEIGSSPTFKAKYPTEAANYLAKAKLGFQFLLNAIAKYGKDGSYQKITHYGAEFMHDDELAWAAAGMFVATGDTQYFTKLKEWFPDPNAQSTIRWGWVRCFEGYGNAMRAYAFAARSGRLAAGQLDATYLAACENQIKLAGDDALRWTTDSAYGTNFHDASKRIMRAGWYFSLDWSADMAVAYQLNPKQAYIDAIISNMNYEAGSNPVNVSFVTGLGLKRQHEIVNQFANVDRRFLPPDGIPLGNIAADYSWIGRYGSELGAMSFPKDGSDGSSYPLQDRWADAWNVTTEFVVVNQARCLLASVAVATKTTAKATAWKSAVAPKILGSGTATVGQPITLSLDASGLDLTNARIVWEARDQMPDFGSTFTFTPKVSGTYWIEVEITWADGRRAFASGSFYVQ